MSWDVWRHLCSVDAPLAHSPTFQSVPALPAWHGRQFMPFLICDCFKLSLSSTYLADIVGPWLRVCSDVTNGHTSHHPEVQAAEQAPLLNERVLSMCCLQAVV